MSIEIDILQKFNQAFETYKTLIIKDNWSLETVTDLLNDFTYNSNKIEGLTLTYGETIQFLSNALVESNTSKIFNLNEDIRMLENHQKALKLIFNQYLNNHFTLDFIIQIQSIIVSSGNELDDFLEKGKGVLRRGNETIYTVLSNGAIKEFCKPELVENELVKLINASSIVYGNFPQIFLSADVSTSKLTRILFNLKDWIGNLLNPKVIRKSPIIAKNFDKKIGTVILTFSPINKIEILFIHSCNSTLL